MNCSPPGSSVLGILQARILEWVAMTSCRGSFRPRDRTRVSHVSCIGRWILYLLSHQESPWSTHFISLTVRTIWGDKWANSGSTDEEPRGMEWLDHTGWSCILAGPESNSRALPWLGNCCRMSPGRPVLSQDPGEPGLRRLWIQWELPELLQHEHLLEGFSTGQWGKKFTALPD